MLLLALEQSSATGSVAVLRDEKILAERAWDSLALRSGGLFACLKDLLAATALNLKDVSCFVVDVGPGSYSGLRSSFAAARAFALPESQAVYALTSAETLAFAIMAEFSADLVQVVGDARRQQLWTCVYKRNGGMPVAQSKIQLVPENNFHPVPGAIVVSPDWKRLQSKLMNMNFKKVGTDSLSVRPDGQNAAGQAVPPYHRKQLPPLSVIAGGMLLIEEPRVPRAGYLGQLAFQKMQLKIPGEPLNPIYLHAAVKEGAK